MNEQTPVVIQAQYSLWWMFYHYDTETDKHTIIWRLAVCLMKILSPAIVYFGGCRMPCPLLKSSKKLLTEKLINLVFKNHIRRINK